MFDASGRKFLENFARDELVACGTFRFEVADDGLNF
jgi:hypothetical protein